MRSILDPVSLILRSEIDCVSVRNCSPRYTIHHFPHLCLFYVKSIYVKSHIIVVKKVELDRRNGYI
ncbi:hypothetical protein FGS48_17325 [Salmonella enterica]|nr:hypothetical protein [Salmonella enterica]